MSIAEWEGVMVVAPRRETFHPMWTRMWERAGFSPDTLPFTALDEFNGPSGPDIHTIIVLGEAALNKVADAQDLFRWRGRMVERFCWGQRVIVAPTLLPSQMLPGAWTDTSTSKLARKPTRFQGAWIRDIQHAVRNAGCLRIPAVSYLEDPTPTNFRQWAERCLSDVANPISFDIETHYKLHAADDEDFEEHGLDIGAMLRISFAYKPHDAVSVAWSREHFDTIRALLESPNPKVCWNGAQFDVPKLRSEGYPVLGRIYDYQDGWHLLESDQPKGLEYVSSYYTTLRPWKHLNGSSPALYSCIDADAALQNALGIEADLREVGLWDIFERHVVDLMPILEEAGIRGNVVDTRYGDALRVELEAYTADVTAQCQSLVPEAVKPRKRYKKLPKHLMVEAPLPERLEADGRVFLRVLTQGRTTRCSVCGAEGVTKGKHLKGGKKNPCAGATIVKVVSTVVEWDEVLAFNPNSSDQMKAYAKHFKHPLGKNHKTRQDTTDAKSLERLVVKYGAQHPLYKIKLDYNKVAKTLSTYIYTPDALGLIHTSYVNAPSTWRLASRNVNLQNVGKREGNKWAKMARRQIVARPGHIFVQADSTSIEAVVTGWLIDDQNFIAVAKKSIHAYLACAELGWAFTDDTIEQVKREHKGLYNQFKTAVYLLLFGGDPYLMYMTNPDVFPTKAHAQVIQDKIFALLPKLKEWQDRTREQAKREGVLVSPWGYRHYFYDVYTFKRYKNGEVEFDEAGNPIIKPGGDKSRALAFRPQNSAASFCRDTLWLIGHSKWRQYMPANISVHDGYCLEVPEALAEEAAEFLVTTLCRPIPEMDNLRIGCEVDMGYNWADASEDNPRGMKTLRKVEV